jgi:acetyl esterase/lipase
MTYLKRKKLAYPVKEGKETQIIKNVIYKTVEGKNLCMDIYLPEEARNNIKLPTVLLVHGEGPEVFIHDAKDWGVYTSYGKLLASQGLVAITFNHRYAAKDFERIKEVTKDVTDAVLYTQRNAEEWNIDLDKLFLWSFSLGGIYSSVFLKQDYHIKAVISYYGLLDISEVVDQQRLEEFKDYIPEYYLRNVKNTKILIVKAAKDKVKGVNPSIDRFRRIADQYRIEYNYLVHSAGGHSFDVFIDQEETREMIDKTLEFIKENSQ